MSQLIAIRNGIAERVFDDPWNPPGPQAARGPQTERGPQAARDPQAEMGQTLTVEQYRLWLAEHGTLEAAPALQLSPNDEPEELADLLQHCPMVALEFEKFTDGRAYSQAAVLRRNMGYEGDIRAVGDVLRDQLVLMQQCGFSSFVIRADKSPEDALKGLQRFHYGFAR